MVISCTPVGCVSDTDLLKLSFSPHFSLGSSTVSNFRKPLEIDDILSNVRNVRKCDVIGVDDVFGILLLKQKMVKGIFLKS